MNKFQKSLDRIKKNLPFHDDKWSDEDKEHIRTVTEALERQIPKKVIFQSEFEGLRYCPCCNVRFIGWGMKYCGECGQALDWSDTE